MAIPLRLMLVAGAAAALTLGSAARAYACGSSGYSYAGFGASQRAFGISARINAVDVFPVLQGHVAGWVGVGSPGAGPAGSNEWLQIGLSQFPGTTHSDLYYEVALPSHFPVYHQLATNLPAGKAVRIGVLEMRNRRNWWRVWLNQQPVSRPIRLPESYERWSPIATAESWDGGTGGACNTFLYAFHGVEVAHSPGGGWHPLSNGYRITSSVTRVRSFHGGAAFFAAEGGQALRLLPSLVP